MPATTVRLKYMGLVAIPEMISERNLIINDSLFIKLRLLIKHNDSL